ncbi:MAG: hypothetical protein B7X04_03155 [Parcubacteria group bacterium 21-54-25]|nr:MAG: hypothetical protein B7X04_03155 [Parcubacteria group bacterium 21-54-25]HQU07987.1 prepilin-type N-terminal cleavage/methylation domain-containing protein [Candidatus Paceibacterota bacterium]
MTTGRSGFTLIELLVVIAIIGLLSSVVLASLNVALQKGNIAAATQEEQQVFNAINSLYADTGKNENGCSTFDPIQSTSPGQPTAIPATSIYSGLSTPPSGYNPNALTNWSPKSTNWVDLYTGHPAYCFWGSPSNWSGPYMSSVPVDPWGKPYWFKSDYYPYAGCASPPAKYAIIACTHTGTILGNTVWETASNQDCAMNAIVSGGPNKINGASVGVGDCDDVFTNLSTGVTYRP